MNIIQIQNQLKGVPDDTLVGYVQNPTGQVPTYLALSELQRRKEMRQNYQANKPEEKTVAEDLIQETEPQPQPQPGIAGLSKEQPMQQAMASQSEMPMEQMAQGGLAELDTGNMYNENSYANGGIVAFAAGGRPDKYGITMPIVPTMDDMYMQTQEAQRAFGVDPDFYKKALEESKSERLKELESAKKMDQAQLLISMGSAFAGTPTFGKALSVAGEKAAPIIGAMGKNQREINSLYKMADRKSIEAQYAQSRGDAQGAQKAINEKEGLLLTAQMKEAELKSAEGIAATKATAANAGKAEGLRAKEYDQAAKDFASSFPAGAEATVFSSNPGFLRYVKNVYLENAKDYIRNDKMPVVPTESQLLDMFNKGKSKSNNTRPAAVDKIFKKHSSGNKKYNTTNTDEELLLTDPKYDNLGSEDDDN
jgi:hypothetical protein